MNYTITFTFPVPDEWDTDSYVQSVIEAIDDVTQGEANIIAVYDERAKDKIPAYLLKNKEVQP